MARLRKKTSLSLPSEAQGKFRNFNKCTCDTLCLSVTTISYYSFEVIGLKFGMKTHLFNAIKFTNQIFEFLSRS